MPICHARTLLCAALLYPMAWGADAPRFEVASVKPNTIGMKGGESGAKETIQWGPAALNMTNVRLVTCIATAYSIREYQLNVPAWMESERFDIAAKAGASVPATELRSMLQTLLAERFHLTLHHVQKELPVYALVVARNGLRVKESSLPGTPAFEVADGAFRFLHMSMEDFSLRISGSPFHLDRPVVDRTGLAGVYDFSLKIAAGNSEMKRIIEALQTDSADNVSIATLIQEQLGLKLEPRKRPVEMLVIDSADKVPTEN